MPAPDFDSIDIKDARPAPEGQGAPPQAEISSVPEDVALARAQHPVMSASEWDTAKRIPLRTFLAIATTDPKDRADMAQALSRFGLGEGAQVSTDPGGNLMVTDAKGQTTPLDPATFGKAETFADVAEELRAAPMAIGSTVAGAAALPIAGALGQPGIELGARMTGAGAGEAVRQGIESTAMHAILGRPSAQTWGQRATDIAAASGAEAVFPALQKFGGKVLTAVGVRSNPGYQEMLAQAEPATERLRQRATEAGIKGASHVQLGAGEKMGPIYRSVVNQLRNLTSAGGYAQQQRSHVVYQLVRDAAAMTPGDNAALRATMEDFQTARRNEGVQLVRDLVRTRDELPAQDLYTVAKARTKQFRDRMQEETRANYAAAGQALRDSGASLRYDASGALQHIDETIPLKAIELTDPATGARYSQAIAEDLGPRLAGVQQQIEIGQRDGWRTLYTADGRELSPEDRIHKLMMELDDMHDHYSQDSSKNRGTLRVIDGVRDELSGTLQNPDVVNGDPALVAAAKQMRADANKQFGVYRDIMNRLDATGLASGGTNASNVFESFTKGSGTEYLDILRDAPELRDAVAARYADAAALNPDTWADQVIKTKPEVMMGILGGDTPENRQLFSDLVGSARLMKSRHEVIAGELKSEVEGVRAAGNVLFGANRDAADEFARRARDLPPDDPARMRIGASIASRIFDKSMKERPVGPGSIIDAERFHKAMAEMRDRGLVDLLPDDMRQLLNDVELHGEAAPGSGGMAMGLVSAEAGANVRRAIAVALAAGAGVQVLGGKEPGKQDTALGTAVKASSFIGASELAAVLLSGRGTGAALRAVAGATNPQAKLAAQAQFMYALTRQSLVGNALRNRRQQAEARRAANTPQPAGL